MRLLYQIIVLFRQKVEEDVKGILKNIQEATNLELEIIEKDRVENIVNALKDN